MEGRVWFSHKYIMHGFLWSLHKDHHKKDHKSWFERNDFFFVIYALVSAVFVVAWGEFGFAPGWPLLQAYLRMALPILWYTIFLFTSALKSFATLTIVMQRAFVAHTKYTTKTSTKKTANVLVCCGFR